MAHQGHGRFQVRAMFFQFAGHTIDQTFDAEKKLKDDLSDVPFA